ncbi:MAG: DUF3465 domain-containing protein [Methylotenera sp.]|nr:DUF3465 domain-containing protein [Methylotenera sp.]MDP1754458.1 DUF3465 domain-containing protein [Methylotenera sp.]MDP1960271.1 DUF3465 domain-containing protein [Methylotenera sp.]MDP3206504.1 DUF3465 domain-containing protein [Methylotenera sp.]MDP3303911.1 DUF3465 domain-containing protein [Methylotenera sp.]
MSVFSRLLFALFLALALIACKQPDTDNTQQLEITGTVASADTINSAIEQAFAAKRSDVQVSGKGKVIKLLADDNKDSRHQKFLVKINTQQTLLFAHNIDLAPRVPLQIGDEVSFNGEYVYNPKGGIIHWTHHAPQGDHEAGWVMLNGRKYQ